MTPYAKLVESLAHSGITDQLEVDSIAVQRNIEIDFVESKTADEEIEVTPETKTKE